MGLIRRWIDVEPNRHSEILRSAPDFPKCRPQSGLRPNGSGSPAAPRVRSGRGERRRASNGARDEPSRGVAPKPSTRSRRAACERCSRGAVRCSRVLYSRSSNERGATRNARQGTDLRMTRRAARWPQTGATPRRRRSPRPPRRARCRNHLVARTNAGPILPLPRSRGAPLFERARCFAT